MTKDDLKEADDKEEGEEENEEDESAEDDADVAEEEEVEKGANAAGTATAAATGTEGEGEETQSLLALLHGLMESLHADEVDVASWARTLEQELFFRVEDLFIMRESDWQLLERLPIRLRLLLREYVEQQRDSSGAT